MSGPEEGTYTCIADNQEGVVLTAFMLVITNGAAGGSNEDKLLKALAGSHLLMECGVFLMADSDLLWKHNGRVVRGSDRVKVERNGSLVISGLLMEDSGLYKCVGANTRGWIEARITLEVIPREGMMSCDVITTSCDI